MRDAGWSAPHPHDRGCINEYKDARDDAIAAPPTHVDQGALGAGVTGRHHGVFVAGTDASAYFLQQDGATEVASR
jgi:hypothetical protein